MFWKSTLILAAAGLQSVSAAALPAAIARDDTQCAPGTAFYVCNLNSFRGCCSIDPCALTEGCPDTQPGSCGKAGLHRVYNPGMRIVGKDGPQPNDFHVIKSNNTLQEQTMYFSLPADAKDCSLRWGVPAEDERVFTVEGSGYVSVTNVNDDGSLGERIGGADFTYWDEDPKPHDGHTVGGVDCIAEPKFRITPASEDNGEVYIDQNDHTGWYIEYSC